MSTINKLASYPASTSVTCTLASLASSATAGREATAVDNSTNLYLDCLLIVKIALGTGTLGADPTVYIYAAGSIDGTAWPDNVTGSDAAITPHSWNNLRLAGTITFSAQSQTHTSEPLSIGNCFGVVPYKWNPVILNSCGIVLAASGSSIQYIGITTQNV